MPIAMAAEPDYNMGLFSKLPFELRDLIWTQCSYTIKSALVRTCKGLNCDVNNYLYENLSLAFNIDPHHDKEPSPSLVRVLDQEFESICILTLGSLQNEERLRFWSFPFDKVERFTFILWPPSPSPDRIGEVIRLWMMVSSLLTVLRKNIIAWPRVFLNIKESVSRRWKTLEGPCCGIAEAAPSEASMCDLNDIFVALQPFSTLRRLPCVLLFSKYYSIPKKVHTFVSQAIDGDVIQKQDYGHDISWEDGRRDSECESELAEWNIWFERQLDVLDDASAASLRLERYANWSKLYEKEYGCWVWGRAISCSACQERNPNDSSWGGARLWSYEDTEEAKQVLWDRYYNMRCLNPGRLPGNDIRYDWLDDKEAVTYRDGWDVNSWWDCYKDGIPPLLCNSTRRGWTDYVRLCYAGQCYEVFSEIDRDGIKLWHEPYELDRKKGGWRSWPDEEFDDSDDDDLS